MKGQKYTLEQVEFLRVGFKVMRIPELTTAFNQKFKMNRTESQLHSAIKRRKIKCGRDGRFKKGNRPWNTGTKGLVSGNSGSFKKGNIPYNTKPMGSERVSKDGYIMVKITECDPYTGSSTRYMAKHHVVWEAEYGPVTNGYILFFRDGNKQNCSLDNLEMITREEQVRRNQLRYGSTPDELKPAVKALARISMRRGQLKGEV